MSKPSKEYTSFIKELVAWVNGKYGASFPKDITNLVFCEIATNEDWNARYWELAKKYQSQHILNACIGNSLYWRLKATSHKEEQEASGRALDLITTYTWLYAYMEAWS